MKLLIAAVAAVAVLAVSAWPAGAEAAPSRFTLGVAEGTFRSSDPFQRHDWLRRARRARATLTTFAVHWRSIAPDIPREGFRPSDPGDPAYDWGNLDTIVRDAVNHGLTPMLTINRAPGWAEGPNRPSVEEADRGTWMPDPRALNRFAAALALRYSGRYPDPTRSDGARLPRVHYFQIWAEQNLFAHLNPQWRKGRMFAPHHYRHMLNAAYRGIKRINPRAKVVTGGTAPFGDPEPSGRRVPPVWFWRSFLCLRGGKLRPMRCPNPARFDIAAHNPISNGNPARQSLNSFDVTTSGVHRLQQILRRAVQTRRALPRGPKPFWASELFWDSRPPDPDGIPLHLHTRYVTTSLFILWKQNVSAVVWWYLRDQPEGSGWASSQQSGLFFLDGEPKPAFAAFRFPFLGVRARHRSGPGVFLWGKAPRRGRVTVEVRRGRNWQAIARPRARARRGNVFTARIPKPRGSRIRARQRGESSLPWRLR